MGSKSFTFIELHLDGTTQFGPKSLGEASVGDDDDAEFEEIDAADEEDGGGKPVGVLVGLLLLVGVGLAVRKLRAGDDDGEFEEFEAADEPDVVVD